MRQTALNMVYELAKQDPRIFFIGSDLGHDVLGKMKAEMPERFFMEGVSEAHIIGMAAGMAMEGKIVYCNTIATFFSRRAYEQIVLDLCLHNLPVRLINNGGGLVYAPLGPTHLAIEDMAILRTVPNLTIVAPADANEMKRLMVQTVSYDGPIYIRVAKGGDPIVTTDDIPFEIGKAIPRRQGKDALLISTGITLKHCLEAADILAQRRIEVTILHVPTIKPLDTKTILEYAARIPIIVTIEEGVRTGGLGSAVAELICESDFKTPRRFRRLGVPDEFPDKYGAQDTLMNYLGISTQNLVATVTELV